MSLLADITVYLYFAILLLLSIYGLHRYFILYLYFRHYKFGKRLEVGSLDEKDYPTVTVQLPLFQ